MGDVGSCDRAGQVNGKLACYLAGPMRGKPLYGFPIFDAAAEEVRRKGWFVINPADLDRQRGFDPTTLPIDHDWSTIPPDFDLHGCIQDDVSRILSCDAIVMLPGWEDSRGACAEKGIAEWAGKWVLYYNDGTTAPTEQPASILPEEAEARKEYPIFKGVLDYFPNACLAVAHHSYISNEQHNAGEPMHWAKEKSIGTGDQIVRHLMEGHYEAMAWRALELLERKLTGLPPFDATSKDKREDHSCAT